MDAGEGALARLAAAARRANGVENERVSHPTNVRLRAAPGRTRTRVLHGYRTAAHWIAKLVRAVSIFSATGRQTNPWAFLEMLCSP